MAGAGLWRSTEGAWTRSPQAAGASEPAHWKQINPLSFCDVSLAPPTDKTSVPAPQAKIFKGPDPFSRSSPKGYLSP